LATSPEPAASAIEPIGRGAVTRSLPVGLAVTVEVPATTANLGPGFDCFGLALDWYERVHLQVLDAGYSIDVSGEGAAAIPRDESHLIIHSALVGLADLGVRAPGLGLRCRNTIPHGRGLGSSSAAIVAGLVAAGALADEIPDSRWLLTHATAIEGHPDNVAAAIYGGFVLAYESEGIQVAQGGVREDVGVAVFVANSQLATEAARRLLPEMVPHGEAAANSARSALLVHSLAVDPGRLLAATCDWLHQSYREPAMPRSSELMNRLRGKGFAAVISGAGPSVLVLGRTTDLEVLSAEAAPGFTLRLLGIGRGAESLGPAAR
jgi:homoserine kinase